MRARPAFSPAGNGSGTRGHAERAAGISPRAASAARAACAARVDLGRGGCAQARQNGLNTRTVAGLGARPPTSATKLPGSRRGSTPASRAPPPRGGRAPSRTATRRRRSDAVAPVLAASAGSSRSGLPRAHDELAAAVAQRRAQLAQHSSRKRARGPDAKRPRAARSSSTNTGTTRSRAAAPRVSAGWSCTRRSRRNQTSAVTAISVDTDARGPADHS